MIRIFVLAMSAFMLFIFANVSFAKDYDKGRGHGSDHQDRGKDDYRNDHGGHGDDYRNHPGYRPKSRHDNYKHEHSIIIDITVIGIRGIRGNSIKVVTPIMRDMVIMKDIITNCFSCSMMA